MGKPWVWDASARHHIPQPTHEVVDRPRRATGYTSPYAQVGAARACRTTLPRTQSVHPGRKPHALCVQCRGMWARVPLDQFLTRVQELRRPKPPRRGFPGPRLHTKRPAAPAVVPLELAEHEQSSAAALARAQHKQVPRPAQCFGRGRAAPPPPPPPPPTPAL